MKVSKQSFISEATIVEAGATLWFKNTFLLNFVRGDKILYKVTY